MNEEETIAVHYKVMSQRGKWPFGFRRLLSLEVDGEDTGIRVIVWGSKREKHMANAILESASELLNELGLAEDLFDRITAKRAAATAAEERGDMRVNDTVRLLVDIGPYKRGRVMKVVDVANASGYKSRGGKQWDDNHYPVKVVPLSAMPGELTLDPEDGIPLTADEFCPGDKEVE